MSSKHTLDELNNLSREELITIILGMQGQLDALNENIEKLIEQVRLANQQRFGRHTETMESIEGQLSFFDEADALYNPLVQEPDPEDVIPGKAKKKKAKGQREEDLKDFPEEIIPAHTVSREALDAFYGAGNWRQMPSETYKRLRHEPESWTVEVHTVDVFVGTDGEHQDEFMRGDRPKDLFRGSIATPSLLASILNVKYVNSAPLHRIEQEFSRNGVNISKQTMSNWIIGSANRYFAPLVESMKKELLKLPVTQSDETPTQVIHDDRNPGSKSYMWVHRSGEFYTERPIVIYEYQKGRNHELPLHFYQDYEGILVTDGLSQYHLIEKKLPGLTNANCWAHTRRDYADAIKIADKAHPDAEVIEMDTVKGTKNGGKVFLTMLFRNSSFMLIFLLPQGKQMYVQQVFDTLTELLGPRLFQKTFPVILTDNGPEFKNPSALEFTDAGRRRTYIFYCDPYVSNQKGRLEKNHEFIRYVLPKGKSFSQLTAEDVRKLTNHINSVARDNLNGATPFDLASILINKKVLASLGLEKVSPDEVLLKPALFKK